MRRKETKALLSQSAFLTFFCGKVQAIFLRFVKNAIPLQPSHFFWRNELLVGMKTLAEK